MKLILWTLLLLVAAVVSSGDTALDFPLVYTAVVPAFSKESSTDPNAVHFAAEVDFLGVLETGLSSPNGGNDYVRIAFLVHDEDELARLSTLVVPTSQQQQQQQEPLSPSQATLLEVHSDMSLDLHLEATIDDDDYNNNRRLQQFSTISGYGCYKDVKGSYDFLYDLERVANAVPSLSAEVEVIGESFVKTVDASSGYDLLVFRLTGVTTTTTTTKGILFAMTGIHAREYSPPELVSRWLEELVDGYRNGDAETVSILDHTEIHVVLQANPDGRNVAETNRLLYRRKNLNRGNNQCGGGSYGVDLNRNFPFRWGLNSGSSGSACSQTYRGASAGSEPEVKAIVQYLQRIFPDEQQRKQNPEGQQDVPFPESTTTGIFFDIHSYGEIIIWPWGHVNEETGNDSGLEGLASKFRHFNGYGFAGPQTDGYLYPASGATDDWAYGVLGASAMTFELGTAFYQRCDYFESSILPRNLPALTYAAKVSRAPYSLTKGPDVIALTVSPTIVTDDPLVVIVAEASDAAWSNHATSQQTLTDIRLYLDTHPYDLPTPTGNTMKGDYQGLSEGMGTFDLDTSGLDPGRHMVYVHATDSAGYTGPVSAISFLKQGSTSTNAPITPSPVGTPSPIAPAPVGTPSPASATPVCENKSGVFQVDVTGQEHDCDWLIRNLLRFGYLCQYIDVAYLCPLACAQCELFGLVTSEG